MKKTTLILLAAIFAIVYTSDACTTAVISGKATPDGRSIIWKLRDTDNLENSIRYFTDGKYPYLGLINSKDTKGENVWAGSNSMGFAIMNSASYNVNVGDTTSLKDMEGVFMKLALQTCASLADFEQLLNTYPRPRGLAAHFGVIDAHGGAAFYEVNNQTWTKFDANEAPEGYVIRTNYSETGTPDEGYGFIRRQNAEKIFADASKQNSIDTQTIMQQFSRCFYHSVFGLDYRTEYETGNYKTDFIASDDLITRHSSVSSIVVQGIKKGESPDMNTVWVQVGFPETCLSLPLWVLGEDSFPDVLKYNETLKNSPLNTNALKWKKNVYPVGRSDGYHYLKISELINPEKTGYVQRIEQIEKDIFAQTEEMLAEWRKKTPDIQSITSFYNKLDKLIEGFYEEELD
ncbi:MAG: hypothetical protein BWZ00_00577 [Bacteroidetes bacterium ADurb.BinA174]|nr:MAG: hypothetical protein BWZ00_00577 [Bacteroidetes bacterium ADurb.BinA174]